MLNRRQPPSLPNPDVKKAKVFSFLRRSKAVALSPLVSTSIRATEQNKPLPPPKDISTWARYNTAYALGELDFDTPPPPPTKLEGSGAETASGQHRPPPPLNEHRRQRAVDALGMNSRKASNMKDPVANRLKEVEWDDEASSNAGSCSSSDSASSRASSSSSSTTSSTLPTPPPKQLSTYPVLQELAIRAAKQFGTGVSSVSLMDEDQQVFLAEVGLNIPQLERDSTVCGHTMLKASTGQTDPLVVLDLSNDWRFAKNNFGQWGKGFYAALPIFTPAPFGDTEAQTYPCGIFCILDDKPRASFSEAERAELASLADEAGAEIARFREEKRDKDVLRLSAKQDDWRRKSRVVRKIALKSSLDTVAELSTPPTSPELEEQDEGVPRRPSLLRTLTSESATSVIVTTEFTPTSCSRRGSGDAGIHATITPGVPLEVKAVLDLSTKLIAESLELDFTYILAIDLATASTSASASKQLRLLSTHNFPLPAPLFSPAMHLETVMSPHSALLYSNPDYTGAEGDYKTGLLVKISVSDGVGFILGGFSESRTRVLDRQDFLFFRTFAQDVAKHLVGL